MFLKSHVGLPHVMSTSPATTCGAIGPSYLYQKKDLVSGSKFSQFSSIDVDINGTFVPDLNNVPSAIVNLVGTRYAFETLHLGPFLENSHT
jgi:hypothetical protein